MKDPQEAKKIEQQIEDCTFREDNASTGACDLQPHFNMKSSVQIDFLKKVHAVLSF